LKRTTRILPHSSPWLEGLLLMWDSFFVSPFSISLCWRNTFFSLCPRELNAHIRLLIAFVNQLTRVFTRVSDSVYFENMFHHLRFDHPSRSERIKDLFRVFRQALVSGLTTGTHLRFFDTYLFLSTSTRLRSVNKNPFPPIVTIGQTNHDRELMIAPKI
jgi:hypothetical protein